MMEKVNKSMQRNKKIFLRKEIEPERLGEEIYSEDILCEYSVYLVRKFEEPDDYTDFAQIDLFLQSMPEGFNQDFKDIVIKKLFVRQALKSVYITLLLALPQPLSKIQITELKEWMDSLEVPSVALEHTTNFSGPPASESMVREWQETNSEVLLLTEMMNQFNGSLTDVYTEIQQLKNKKTPPVMKVVKSEAAVKKTTEKENENSQRLNEGFAKIEKLTTDFEEFKEQVAEQLEKLEEKIPEPKTPPKFKIFLDGKSERRLNLEERLDKAMSLITTLTSQTDFSKKEIERLAVKLEKESRKSRELYRNQNDEHKLIEERTKLEDKMTVTSDEVTSISQQLKEINTKLSTVENKVSKVEQTPEQLKEQEQEKGKIQETFSETMKLNEVIEQLTKKLTAVETELIDVKEKDQKQELEEKPKKDEKLEKLSEQHQKDQEQLKANALEINKLSQTISRVDVLLIQANQKIAELEKKVRNSSVRTVNQRREEGTATAVNPKNTQSQPAVQQPAPKPVQQGAPKPVPRPAQQQAQANPSPQPKAGGQGSGFPSKESFLQATSPRAAQQRPAAAVKENDPLSITLSIEEMLNKMDEPQKSSKTNTNRTAAFQAPPTVSLRRLKKLEEDIYGTFKKAASGIGSRGMISKEDVYANIRQIEVIPYLWSILRTDETQDLFIKEELSCKNLVDNVPDFLVEIEAMASKRKVMGKWIYAPKELELRMEGYKLLNEYFELLLSNKPPV